MDRGLLSEPRLLEASRDFVCVRLITYQNKTETAFLKTIGGSSTGGVLNTSFALLAPDGKTVLSGTGRSPRQPFRGTEEETLDKLIAAMDDIKQRYRAKGTSRSAAVPYLASPRVGLNVASCDNQPLVVVLSRSAARRKAIERQLAPLSWSPEFRGRFAFAHTARTDTLEMIDNAPQKDAVMVIQPDVFGLEGRVLAQTNAFSRTALQRTLKLGLSKYEPLDKSRSDKRAGQRSGVSWEEDLSYREADPENTKRARRRRERE